MKLLSIAIPCYNSAEYMDKAIESLLVGGEEIEIIIVDDGSVKDDTAQIADRYAEQYPTIIKAIHQENGGHGEAVNTGIKHATGMFFKVVDSDDWVNPDAYAKILSTLRIPRSKQDQIDMLISNFVYEKQGAKHKKVMSFKNKLPEGEIFTWSDTKKLRNTQYILMHSVIYRTELLRECKLKLPAHTFYVDNIFVFQPLPYVKNIFYLNVDFYRYFIGRDDQSVNEKVMIKRLDQQIRVNRFMIDSFEPRKIKDKKCRQYMISYLTIITAISTVMCIRSNEEKNLQVKLDLWNYIKEKDETLYKVMHSSLIGRLCAVKRKVPMKLAVSVYRVVQKCFGFN